MVRRDEEDERDLVETPHEEIRTAGSLQEAAYSSGSLQGYAAVNDVEEDTEIAQVAAADSSAKPAQEPTEADENEEIGRLAYQYSLQRNGEGSPEDDWYRAEAEIRRRSR